METEGYQQFRKLLGKRLQDVRKARGISQEKAAELIGVDRVMVGYIEQGRRAPSLQTLYRISLAYETEPMEFFVFTKEMDA